MSSSEIRKKMSISERDAAREEIRSSIAKKQFPPSPITPAPNLTVPAAAAEERSRHLALPPMNPHHQITLTFLDSAAPPPNSEICIMDNGSIVKIMETVSYLMEVHDFSSHFDKGMGHLIESSPFGVGGYSFSIQLYPNGADYVSFLRRDTSLFIKNLSLKTAHLAADLYLVNRHKDPSLPTIYGLFSSLDRKMYHQVVSVQPGAVYGKMNLYPRSCIAAPFFGIKTHSNSVKIMATIGIVSYHIHHPYPLPKHSSSCILFQVEGCLYYALESIITTRCPALLQDYPHSNHIVLIPDVESHVFKAVLWFLHNNKLHEDDRKDILDNGKELFSRRLIEAADKFNLKDLRRYCESLLYYGDSMVLDCYYRIESNVKELWENVSGLPQKMKELSPQKMKAA